MWLVGITKPMREEWAQRFIEDNLGLQTYLPRFKESYLDVNKKVAERIVPLFPRYLFIETDGHWRFLFDTFGIAGVLRHFDECPVELPPAGLQHLHSREDKDGLIVLPERLSRRFQPLRRYQKGQKVRVSHGPLVGYSGVCLGDKAKARVWVLLRYLGRSTPVLVAREQLIAA